jgi:CelD/BcsL family acetyltransferase involved in cellulose biosynthesis
MRREARRQERRLERDHGLRWELLDGAGGAGTAHFDRMFALHSARWRDGGSLFVAHASFHREFAAIAAACGWLRIWIAVADGRDVAASYGFRLGGVESEYQGGRDPDWAGPSPGFALQAHTIRAALEDGMREYRLLRGGEAYKYRFADDDPGVETVLVARGSVAAAAAAAAAAGAALPPSLTSLVRRTLR